MEFINARRPKKQYCGWWGTERLPERATRAKLKIFDEDNNGKSDR
jgi:hypothetical protein